MKAIIKRCEVENCVRQLSRHATPQRFTHLCLTGLTGRQFYEHVDTGVAGVFVFGLEDWATVPALAKGVEGDPMHRFAGRTSTEQVSAEDFARQDKVDLYISGWVMKFVNFRRRDGVPCIGLKLDDSTFLDAITPAGVVYRSDEDDWANVPDLYKLDDGTALADPDDVKETTLITPPPEE